MGEGLKLVRFEGGFLCLAKRGWGLSQGGGQSPGVPG